MFFLFVNISVYKYKMKQLVLLRMLVCVAVLHNSMNNEQRDDKNTIASLDNGGSLVWGKRPASLSIGVFEFDYVRKHWEGLIVKYTGISSLVHLILALLLSKTDF